LGYWAALLRNFELLEEGGEDKRAVSAKVGLALVSVVAVHVIYTFLWRQMFK
jgi:hypothetical protein